MTNYSILTNLDSLHLCSVVIHFCVCHLGDLWNLYVKIFSKQKTKIQQTKLVIILPERLILNAGVVNFYKFFLSLLLKLVFEFIDFRHRFLGLVE